MFFEKINFKYLNKVDNDTLVLFLHGWGCSMESFKYFERFFSSQFNVLNVDLYGFGDSKLPLTDFGVYDYAKNIYLLLKKFKFNKLVIVCHSFGFRVATVLTTCFDLDVSSLIVTGGAGLKPRFNLKIKLKIIINKVLKKHFKKKNVSGSVDFNDANVALRKVLVKVVNQHLDYLVCKIKVKTVLFWGVNDKETPIYMAKKINKMIDNSRLKMLKGGHFAFLENKLYFAEASLNFILDGKL